MTMRRILVDHARRRNSAKRGAGELVPLTLIAEGAGEGSDTPLGDVELLDLDRALTRFAAETPRAAKVVELRYFGGLELEEIAAALDTSLRTVERDWRFARVWLRDALAPAR
jgi:RNA polymerase sigma factor (TIGR02999 family)